MTVTRHALPARPRERPRLEGASVRSYAEQMSHRGAAPRAKPLRRRSPRAAAAFILVAVAVLSCILRPPLSAEHGERRVRPSLTTRFARLTHAQWANSVQDLLGVPAADLQSSLRSDPRPAGFAFDNFGAGLSVDDALARDYQRAAAAAAERATSDPALFARILPTASGNEEAAALAFIRTLGLRAHRRELASEEVEQYLSVWREGARAYPDEPERVARVRLVLEAMLQSPYFTYRVVRGQADADGNIELDGPELAARLSFALWNTTPSEELLRRASVGELDEPSKVRDVAAQMLGDERARSVMLSFHAQLLERDRLFRVAPSRDQFPALTDDFAAHAARESDLFLDYQIWERGGGYADLLRSNETFVNAELARVYGLEGSFGESFAKVTLDPKRRSGLLTQVAFLASNATSRDPDPIHRGVFVARRLLCQNLTAPGNLPPLPPAGGRTNRQAVEAHTEVSGSGCAVCHARTINPLGFPFEGYDAVGGERSTDNGLPVNTSSKPTIDAQQKAVRDAVELSALLAESRSAHACYVRQWLEFAYGRPALASDAALVERVGEQSRLGELSVRDVLLELVGAPQFRVQKLEESK